MPPISLPAHVSRLLQLSTQALFSPVLLVSCFSPARPPTASKNLEAGSQADQEGTRRLVEAAAATAAATAAAPHQPSTQAHASNMARMTAPIGQVLRRYVCVVSLVAMAVLGRGREGQEGPPLPAWNKGARSSLINLSHKDNSVHLFKLGHIYSVYDDPLISAILPLTPPSLPPLPPPYPPPLPTNT